MMITHDDENQPLFITAEHEKKHDTREHKKKGTNMQP